MNLRFRLSLNPKVDANDFQHIRGMDNLQSLTVRTDLGDGLKHLKELPLRELSLWPEPGVGSIGFRTYRWAITTSIAGFGYVQRVR